MSKFKGADWYDRMCKRLEIDGTERYKLPEYAMKMVRDFGYLWSTQLIAREPGHRQMILIGVDHKTSEGNPLAHWDPDKDSIYRVCVDPLTQRVEVTSFGMDSVDTPEVGMYTNTSELPMWMQEKLAVLCMMSPTPPTKAVEGVGQRINANTYWLPKP
jgi:hypothetical protein